MSDLHFVGLLVRPCGLKGEFFVRLFRPRDKNIGTARPVKGKVYLVPRGRKPVPREQGVASKKEQNAPFQLSLKKYRFTAPNQLNLICAEFSDRTEIEAWIGSYLAFDVDEVPKAIGDELDSLIGASVWVKTQNKFLGTLEDVRDNGAQALLVVGEQEILIPFVPAWISSFDSKTKEIWVEPKEGLWE